MSACVSGMPGTSPSSYLPDHGNSSVDYYVSHDCSSNMTKSSSVDPPKAGKRKGTRSVSTLTPSQLARKRANDREAQRAIRARTKEHIESLERELDDLRGQQGRDKTVQDLMRRNQALEDELRRLKESVGISSAPPAPGIYQPAYHHTPNPRASPYGHPSPPLPLLQQDNSSSYSSMSEPCEQWSAPIPCSVPSTVSSPSSSGGTDDMCGNYLPTSAPSTLMERPNIPSGMHSPAAPVMPSKVGYDDIKSEFGCPQVSVVPMNPTYHHSQPPLDLYPVYYPASPATL